MWCPGVWNTSQTVCIPEQVNLEIAPYSYGTRTLFSFCSDDKLTYLHFEGKALSFLEFPGTFTKSQKATISFLCLPVCLFIHLHGITWVPLDEFSWNLTFEYFLKICPEIQVSLKSDKNKGCFTEELNIVMITPHWIILRMRDVSHKSCRENQNIHFMSNNISPKIVPFIR